MGGVYSFTSVGMTYFERLKKMHSDRSKLPDYAKPKYNKNPRTTNGMTNCIMDYINYSGHFAERVGNQGQYREGKILGTNIIGRVVKQPGKWVKGSGTAGTADVHARKKVEVMAPESTTKTPHSITHKGEWKVKTIAQTVAIEVKNRDSQSEAQHKYQERIEQTGGVYMIARVGNKGFEEWAEAWEKI